MSTLFKWASLWHLPSRFSSLSFLIIGPEKPGARNTDPIPNGESSLSKPPNTFDSNHNLIRLAKGVSQYSVETTIWLSLHMQIPGYSLVFSSLSIWMYSSLGCMDRTSTQNSDFGAALVRLPLQAAEKEQGHLVFVVSGALGFDDPLEGLDFTS